MPVGVYAFLCRYKGKISILIIVIITGIFLLAALVYVFYILYSMERKKRHRDEKESMERIIRSGVGKDGALKCRSRHAKNLAGDLHDNIGQLLSLTSVLLGSVNFQETQKAEQKIQDAHELVVRSIQELRQLSRLIHGEQVMQLGLIEGIKQEIGWLERSGHYRIEFSEPEEDILVANAEKDLFIYRLFQESLSNIIKHAQADLITIGLKYAMGNLLLTIADNGVGFESPKQDGKPEGLGLHNMRRRVDLLHGKLEIESMVGQGSLIHISIPYP